MIKLGKLFKIIAIAAALSFLMASCGAGKPCDCPNFGNMKNEAKHAS